MKLDKLVEDSKWLLTNDNLNLMKSKINVSKRHVNKSGNIRIKRFVT